MEKDNFLEGQIGQYDKVLQENIEAALPGIIKNILHIDAVKTEELPDSLQHTKERRPDLLKMITDRQNNTFVLHIEMQTTNDPDMVYRMAGYWAMLAFTYRQPVKQYVLYLGGKPPAMATELIDGGNVFRYNLVNLSAINYNIFLESSTVEERMFALLADFGSDSQQAALDKIIKSILPEDWATNNSLEYGRRKNQLRVLAGLRNLATENINFMESLTSFFKPEDDILYRLGEKKGKEEGKEEGRLETLEEKNLKFVTALLQATDFSVAKIASMADVTVDYVLRVKATLQ